jgi:hypothetical protein
MIPGFYRTVLQSITQNVALQESRIRPAQEGEGHQDSSSAVDREGNKA